VPADKGRMYPYLGIIKGRIYCTKVGVHKGVCAFFVINQVIKRPKYMRPYISSMHIQFVLYESNKRLYVTYSYTNESNKITT